LEEPVRPSGGVSLGATAGKPAVLPRRETCPHVGSRGAAPGGDKLINCAIPPLPCERGTIAQAPNRRGARLPAGAGLGVAPTAGLQAAGQARREV